jgi:hypothetical protein
MHPLVDLAVDFDRISQAPIAGAQILIGTNRRQS